MKEDKKVRNLLQIYLQWPLVLSILMLFANAAVLFFSSQAGIAMSVFTILYLICAGLLWWYGKKRLMSGLVAFGADYSWSQKQLLASMELPYGIADTDGRILWTNRALTEILREEKGARRNLTVLFDGITAEELEKMEQSLEVHSSYEDAEYRISVKKVTICPDSDIMDKNESRDGSQQLLAVYLYDETEIRGYIQAITDQKMVAGLIYLDNYDEALESVEEVRRSLLVALIDRKINKYISGINGIVKKLEKDKYFFAIKQRYMPRLEAERFSLLEEVKTVNIGNEMAVTLSIGIGMNGLSL